MTNSKRKRWSQYLISVLCNIGVLFFGLQAGWLSPLQPDLESENSPIGSPPLNVDEISWIGSLPSITLIISGPLFGYCLEKYGRKITLFIATAPNLIAYLLLIFANNIYYVYVSRLISGFCACGAFIVGPIYINETTEPNLRGLLAGLAGSYIKLGIIISYILGGYSSYLVLNLASMSFTLFFLIFYFWMPESPVYLMTVNRKEDAKKAWKKIHGDDYKLMELELSQIENMINQTKHDDEDVFSVKRFFTERITVKATIIVCGIFTIQMMNGYPAIVRYAVDIFRNANKDALNPHIAAILLAIAQLLSALIGALIMDKLGRKTLLMICTFIMGLSLIILSSYLFVKDLYESSDYIRILRFLPTIAMIFYISGYAAGYGSVPFVLVPELYSPKSRGIASTVSNVHIAAVEFVVVKLFPLFNVWIGLAGSLCIFAGNCALGLLFLHYVMFETKGLEFDVVYKKLMGQIKSFRRNSENNKTLQPFIKQRDNDNGLTEVKTGALP